MVWFWESPQKSTAGTVDTSNNLSLSSMELPQQSATAWKMSRDMSPVYTEKEKKTIRRFISTFMPFFYILTVLFWTSYAQAINRSFHTDAVSWTILGCLWSEVLCGYIFFTIWPLFVKFNCEINIGFKSPSIT